VAQGRHIIEHKYRIAVRLRTGKLAGEATIIEAPLVLGGALTDNNEIKFGFKLPFALSILAKGSLDGVVTGLNDIKPDERPPLFVHYLFDAMVTIGSFLLLLSLVYVVGSYRRWSWCNRRWMWRIIVWSGPLSMLAIECGWIFAEVGRQPWILRGYMRTAEGATTSEHVDLMFLLFTLLYIILAVTSTTILRKMFRSGSAEEELASKEPVDGRPFA